MICQRLSGSVRGRLFVVVFLSAEEALDGSGRGVDGSGSGVGRGTDRGIDCGICRISGDGRGRAAEGGCRIADGTQCIGDGVKRKRLLDDRAENFVRQVQSGKSFAFRASVL